MWCWNGIFERKSIMCTINGTLVRVVPMQTTVNYCAFKSGIRRAMILQDFYSSPLEEHKPICSFSRVNSKSWLAPHSSFYHARAAHEVDDDFLKNEKCSCKRKWVWYLSHLVLPKHTLQTPQTINKIVPLLPSVSKKLHIDMCIVHAAANGEFTTVLTWF